MDAVMTRIGSPTGISQERAQVIAVHGSASTGGQWRQLVDKLSPTFDVHTPDLPGYGQQGNVVSSNPTLAGDAGGIDRVVRDASAPVHIVAHSYGAAVAFRYAMDHPEAVASLSLIEPALFHLLRSGRALDMAHYTEISRVGNDVRRADWIGAPARGMSRFVDYWNGAGTWAAMKSSLQEALAHQTSQVARNFAAALAETWTAKSCRKIQCPTLIITGQESRGPAKRVAQIIFDALPQARLRTISGVGHMVPVTHPHIINSLIAEALGEVTAGCFDAPLCEAA